MTATGIELIAEERDRQVHQLGYTAEHDATHDDNDMAFAAACYASPTTIYLIRVAEDHGREERGSGDIRWVEPWPNGWERKSPALPISRDDRLRELTKAGALIAAEIDRLIAREEE